MTRQAVILAAVFLAAMVLGLMGARMLADRAHPAARRPAPAPVLEIVAADAGGSQVGCALGVEV